MAEIIWGLATSHVPSIGAAMDYGRTEDAYWKPLFEGYAPAREWMAQHQPDVAVIVYNDAANAIDVDVIPTFAIGTGERFKVADEGVIQYPQPTAARCLKLGEALGRAIRSFPGDVKVAVFGTGGTSHQLAGSRAGLINTRFDQMFLEKIETDPTSLAALSREQYVEEAGSEGIELIMWLIMWLIMRGALGDGLTRIHDTYHVPASNTAAALALFAAPDPEQPADRTDARQASARGPARAAEAAAARKR